MTRVFVPLCTESFGDFERGKLWEVRRLERRWNLACVRYGERVTLSKGYSGGRIEGVIDRVLVGSLLEIFRRIPFREIEPRAKTRADAIRMNLEVLGKSSDYIAFKVKI